MTRVFVFIALLALAALLIPWGQFAAFPVGGGVPIESLAVARDRIAALPGLNLPLPGWIVLPERGRVVAGGSYAPQPPYGAAVTLTLVNDDTPEGFAAAYEARLRGAGFSVRRVPPPFDFTFATDLAFEANAPEGGNYVIAVLRHNHANRFAQLTFWNAPAPRL